jgi:hypothetical protein
MEEEINTVSLPSLCSAFRACMHTRWCEATGWREIINPENIAILGYEMTDFQTEMCQQSTN